MTALSFVWVHPYSQNSGCDKTFKHFTSGRQTNIITDHKLLKSLFSKCLANTSPRLAKMMLHISDFDVNVLYQKGSKMFLSDALSRLSSHNMRH